MTAGLVQGKLSWLRSKWPVPLKTTVRKNNCFGTLLCSQSQLRSARYIQKDLKFWNFKLTDPQANSAYGRVQRPYGDVMLEGSWGPSLSKFALSCK